MATALTAIFGQEIRVTSQPRRIDRQYAAFAGAHGLTGLHLGSRGYQVIITGRAAASGASYPVARSNLWTNWLEPIQNYLYAYPADYSHMGESYSNMVFDSFQLIRDSQGKAVHYTAAGYAIADFIMRATVLL
jgi:hypothetical protein